MALLTYSWLIEERAWNIVNETGWSLLAAPAKLGIA
jgi:hypothetical protein